MSFEEMVALDDRNVEIAFGILHGHINPNCNTSYEEYEDNVYSSAYCQHHMYV